jgi:hypothetical protein
MSTHRACGTHAHDLVWGPWVVVDLLFILWELRLMSRLSAVPHTNFAYACPAVHVH